MVVNRDPPPVAELIMLHNVLTWRKKVLFIVPYVSLVSEKTAHLEVVFESQSVAVRAFCASQGGFITDSDEEVNIAVCTIEKVRWFMLSIILRARDHRF